MKTIWEVKAERIRRRREAIVRVVVVCVYGVLIGATVWAVCALSASLRENARLEAEAEHAHCVRVWLEGWRS